jgi:transposase-like protein
VSWQVDETYVKVKGKWVYLYRAIDKYGRTVDFYLSSRRNAKAAKRFLRRALRGLNEVMYMFTKGQFKLWQYGQGLVGEIRLITNCLLNF